MDIVWDLEWFKIELNCTNLGFLGLRDYSKEKQLKISILYGKIDLS
jgi:hypothetical protein